MDSRTRLLGSIAAVVLVVAAVAAVAFLVADFRLGTGETAVEQSVATASTDDAGSGLTDRVYLHAMAAADGDLADPVTLSAIAAGLEAQGVTVTQVETLDADFDAPLLVVVTDDRSFKWTPFVLSADVSWRYHYSDAGNGTRLAALAADPNAPVVFSSRDDDRYVQTGELRLTDHTTGLVSLPGYERYLSETMGTTTADTVWQHTR